MLTPEQLESIGNDALKIYEGLEIEIIEEIASRIANVGYANTVVKNDVIIAQEMGMLYQDVINSVAKSPMNGPQAIAVMLLAHFLAKVPLWAFY